MKHENLNYPHKVECYLMGEDKTPEQYPIAIKVVTNPEESKKADDTLKREHPGAWIIHTLID